MTIKYINYKGDTYYLHEKRNAAGKSKYYFSKSTEGNLLENIPEKYEIYENPNGQVFLRPESKKIISEKEIEIVKSSIKKYSNLESFKIDVKKNTIVIYEPDQNITEMIKTFSSFGHNNVDKKYCEKFLLYSPTMRFILIDKEERIFTVERMCYRSFVNGWLELYDIGDIDTLVKEYCYHLGRESFYDLI